MVVSLDKVCVVILCYGDRVEFLRKTLDSVENNSPGKILLIGNSVSKKVKREINRRFQISRKLYEVIFSESNLGSAGGYAMGIERALEINEFPFLWLLDDDNCPVENALEVLINYWNNSTPGSNLALAAHRGTNLELLNDLNGWVGDVPKAGSCVGFHIHNLLQVNKQHEKITPNVLPWTVYGGLFIHSSTVQKIGLPNRDLFLYGDDLEWTRRIVESGGRILPCPEAKIIDLCPSWNMTGGKGSNLVKRIRYIAAFRVYYEVRNRTWIARQYFPGNRLLYQLNRNLFLLSAYLLSLRYRCFRRFKLIRIAILHGEKGRLGLMPESLYE